MYPGKDADNIKPVEGKNLSNATKWVNFINAAYLYTSVPRDDIFPLRRCNLEGVDTFCPNKGNNVLKAMFLEGTFLGPIIYSMTQQAALNDISNETTAYIIHCVLKNMNPNKKNVLRVCETG